ncbi:MAG TPA: FAD-dependent monooxygenase [Noviherbaspirillum sp.]|jgi:2-polyprenyl-6-methoxyphenol hydroxylase-like FAD-dependent oxidoreductase|uniref:FAD-dependent monooxygenase n=1 Tax=Noviherbaspirillum sp. TaxID=1926288 RepID=UPI002F9424F5
MDAEVLIVGAGPTGLMLANQLARRGVRISIIDQNAGPSVRTKALGVQARTLEIYSHLGIAAAAVALGHRVDGANIWTEGRRAARVPMGDIGQDLSPFPFLLILGQDDNERLLGACLQDRGHAVSWNTRLLALDQSHDGVAATLGQADGTTREVHVEFVAGCDGAHSSVRRLCGIDFADAPYEDLFFVADTEATGGMTPGELNIFLWRRGFHLFFPMRGANHWRVVGIVPVELRAREDITFAQVAPFIVRQAGIPLAFQRCGWFSPYRVHHRRAARFRDRRCFLLGDAAHIHSPVGAQGMNTGLQDAYNLAWKLALVCAGRADPGLLDSYDTERAPVAERLLRTTDQGFTFFVSPRWYAEVFRTRILPRAISMAMRRERGRRLAFRTISQIGIRYARSPLSRMLSPLPGDAPCAGDRFPWLALRFTPHCPAEDLFSRLDDTRFTLLLFGQPAPEHKGVANLPGDVQILAVPRDEHNDAVLRRAHLPMPSFFLLRPDGHVGCAGTTLDAAALMDYLEGAMRLRAGSMAAAMSGA